MNKVLSAVLGATLALIASPASAADYVLDLTGSVASGSTATVDAFGQHFTFFTINLSGFDPTTFQVGDTVAASITLDGRLIVPSATVFNGVDLILQNTVSPSATNTTTSGTTVLTDNGGDSLTGASISQTQDQLANTLLNFGGASFAFDAAQSNFTVTFLSASSLTADTALFRYFTADAIAGPALPEPTSWALMIVGLGGVGVAMRRRRAPRPRIA